MTQTPAVHARGLVKPFGEFRAVDGIDLEVRHGEIFGVLGPNGAGKTTMLRMLATLLPIDAGEARIFGVDVGPRAASRAPAGRGHRPVRVGRRGPHREREPVAVRPPAGPALGGRACDGAPPARAVRARGGRRPAAVAVLGRHAAAAGPRGQPDHAAAADLPRRADDRAGPAHARADVGHDPRPGRRGLHRPADDAVPRRGRSARRPDRRDRPRPQGRGGHAGRAQDVRRQLDAPAPAGARRRPGARLRHRPPRPRQRAGADAGVRPHQRAARRRRPRRGRADRPARGRRRRSSR